MVTIYMYTLVYTEMYQVADVYKINDPLSAVYLTAKSIVWLNTFYIVCLTLLIDTLTEVVI